MISAIILAGGKGKRLGIRKAFIKVLGKTMLEHVLSAVTGVVDQIIIPTDDPSLIKGLVNHIELKKISIIKDRFTIRNPLSGILSSVDKVKHEYALILPCDTPLIDSDVIKILLNEVDEVDALIPRWESGYIEPLHSIYKINALKKSSHLFTHNPNMSIRSYLSTFNEIKYFPINRLKIVDPELYTFLNINTLEDLEKVKKILLART